MNGQASTVLHPDLPPPGLGWVVPPRKAGAAPDCPIPDDSDCLHSSPKTVTNQRTAINQKLGLSGAFCLLQFVAEHRYWLTSNPPMGEPSYKKGKTLP